MKKSLNIALAAAFLATGFFAGANAQPAPLYKLSKIIPLGGGLKWDYLHFDPATKRVYVSQGTELTVLNAQTGTVVGHVTGLQGSHGVAIDAASGLGYADSGRNQSITIFALNSLKTIKIIPSLLDADGMVYDPVSDQVFNVGGDANAVLVVDAKTNQAVKTIPLGGAPEFLVADNAGSVYVNISDKDQIVRIDSRTNSITARWPVAPCDSPTGLAIDPATRRLFSSCHSGVMVVLDADTGRLVASLPIGKGTDSAAFDPQRKLAFSANRDGTLTVIHEIGPNTFTAIGNVKTAPGARTMAVDPATGRIFLVTASIKSVGPPKHPNGPPDYTFVPGTVKVLIFDPSS